MGSLCVEWVDGRDESRGQGMIQKKDMRQVEWKQSEKVHKQE